MKAMNLPRLTANMLSESSRYFVGAHFVALKVTGRANGVRTRRQVHVQLHDGSHRSVALTTLQRLAGDARTCTSAWARRAAKDLEAILSAVATQANEDSKIVAVEQGLRRVQSLRAVARHKSALAAEIRRAGDVLEPGDLEGQVLDLGELGRLAIAGKVMDA